MNDGRWRRRMLGPRPTVKFNPAISANRRDRTWGPTLGGIANLGSRITVRQAESEAGARGPARPGRGQPVLAWILLAKWVSIDAAASILDHPMLAPRSSQGKLYAIAVAIEAAAERDPYPRLAQFMRTLATQPAEPRTFARPPARGSKPAAP